MKSSGSKTLAIVIGAVGALWCLGVLALAGQRLSADEYMGALVFVLIAAAAAVLYLLFVRCAPGRQAVEEGAVSLVVTIAFVAVAVIVNTRLLLMALGGFNKPLILINIALLVAYAVALMFVEQSTRRLASQLDRTAKKTASPVNISSRLGTCLGSVENAEVRARLLKLKEAVDYSSNVTTGNTAELERRMHEYIDELFHMITEQKSDEEMLDKIKQMELCWKMRSSAASSLR